MKTQTTPKRCTGSRDQRNVLNANCYECTRQVDILERTPDMVNPRHCLIMGNAFFQIKPEATSPKA
ncbi:hypothetical protein A6C57_23540 [Fibrella sp. ES10-3-2-2]|nr:hypothetical protein A6C57_23540 [Fibrella sp. ES10-3-2-2]